MEENKKKCGSKKFFLGALIGGITGAIANRFYQKNREEIKSNVEGKIEDLTKKFNDFKAGAEEKAEDAKEDFEEKKEKAEKVEKVAKKEAEKVGKAIKAGAEKVEKTAKNA